MTHVELVDITGTRWVGDPSDETLTEDEQQQLADLLSNFRNLNHLSLEVGGAKHYFNPAHIVAVSLHEEG